MKDNLLFSIIIPIYNVQNYLTTCIRSVINQDFIDYELILIDDGSTDNSEKICDEYAKNNKHIYVIHKENTGSSDSRNVGLNKALGKYIIFLDSDDYWCRNDALSKLASTIKQSEPDIVFLKNILYFEKINKYLHPYTKYDRKQIKNQTKENVLKYMIESQQLTVFAWDKVIKKELITNNKIRFKTGLYLDDIDWFPKIMLTAKTFDALNLAFYVHRKQRDGSITLTTDITKLNDMFRSIKHWYKIIKKGNYEKDVKVYMLAFYALLYSVLLGYIYSVKGKNSKYEFNKFLKEVKEYSWIFKYDSSLVVKIMKIIYKLFGINAVSFLMSKYSNYYYQNLYRFFTRIYLTFSPIIKY